MYLVLDSRPDRMGSNVTWHIMQIIFAHYNKWFIHDYGISHDKSIFIQMIKKFVTNYTYQLGEKTSHDHQNRGWFIELNEQDWPGNNMKVTKNIQRDMVSYFKEHIYPEMSKILYELIEEKKYVYSELPSFKGFKKTIAVHLRLEDVCHDRSHYNGSYSTEYYREKLNNGNININLEEERLFFEKKGIYIQGYGRHYNPYDCQAPISESKIQEYIDLALIKYPAHDVVLVSSPLTMSKIKLPYPIIASNDIDRDLAFLCNCDVLICSKSLYCFSSVYLGKASEVIIPMWGHITGTGLTSKYDQTTNITYVY